MKRIIFPNLFFFIGLLLTLSVLWPLFAASYFSHHDDVQIIRLYEMDKCFKDGQVPCRWVPDLGGVYGYPIFNYYAPLPYYFGELIYFLTGSLLISSKTMFALSFVGAYIFMFLLGSRLWGKMGGSMSAIFYSFAPYHAVDFYVRGAMGEMWALMFFPLNLWAVLKLKEKCSLVNLLIFGVSVAGLILSHNLSTMIFFPLLLIWIILLFLQNRSKRFLWFVLGAIVAGLTLSSFYLLPAIAEKSLVHVETTVSGYFSYTEHFKGLRKLFMERSWGYGASVREVPGGERDGLSFQIGWVHLVGWVLALITAKILWKKNKKISYFVIFFSIASLLSIFMINPRSVFVWNAIDPLKYLQFPWRFLVIVILFVSLMAGSVFTIDFKKKKLIWVLLVFAVVILNFSYFRPDKFIQTNDQQLLSGKDWDKQIKRSIFDYLPIYAKEPPAELATVRYQILTGDSRIFNYKEGTNWFIFNTETRSHTIIRLSQYYFPDWKIFLDGKEMKVEYKNNSLGLMTIILGEGDHQIWARLYDTPIRTIANMMTLLGFATVLVLFLISSCKVRKWFLYYRKRMN